MENLSVNNISNQIQHKINKYRNKSLLNSGVDTYNNTYEERLMYYVAQNRIISQHSNINNQLAGGSKTTRKSPEQSATLYKVGTKKTGNDGNTWIIDETNTGVKRWKLFRKKINPNNKSKSKSKSKSKGQRKRHGCCVQSKEIKEKFMKLGATTKSFIPKNKLTSRPREYLIHDNGGRPFNVVATNKGIDIFTMIDKKSTSLDYNEDPVYDQHILSLKKFIGYWVGFDTSSYTNYHGNSILVQETKTSYVSIGWMIFRFTTDEEILDYVSPVGNSDVPYPIAYTKNYVYFMLDDQYVKKSDLTTQSIPIEAENIYGEYYGHLFPENQNIMKKIKIKGRKLLVKRRW
jgi:hypothetical protein